MPARRDLARTFGAVLASATLTVCAAHAGATYSIAAADTRTHATGGAGTSCLSGDDVYIIYGGVPGIGTVNVQSVFDQFTHDAAVRALASGASPADVIATVTAPAFDPDASERQYGVVDVTGRTAAFTGADDNAYAGDRQGRAGDFVYSAQGNFLTSRAVIDQASDAFEASGCDLADRLILALEAGAAGAEGDRRCTASRGIPSDSAFLEVDLPDAPAGSYLELRVPNSGSVNPLHELRAAFDAWRLGHPCPETGPQDGGLEGATAVTAAASAGVGRADGCACGVPPARSPKNSLAGALLAGLALLCRAKSPHRVRGAHSRLP